MLLTIVIMYHKILSFYWFLKILKILKKAKIGSWGVRSQPSRLRRSGCYWLSIDWALNCHWLPLTAIICHWLPLTAIDSHWLPLTAIDCNWLPLAYIDWSWLPLTTNDCHWLPLTAIGCHWLLLAAIDCQFETNTNLKKIHFAFWDFLLLLDKNTLCKFTKNICYVEKNTFCNLRQIYFVIQDKYILHF